MLLFWFRNFDSGFRPGPVFRVHLIPFLYLPSFGAFSCCCEHFSGAFSQCFQSFQSLYICRCLYAFRGLPKFPDLQNPHRAMRSAIRAYGTSFTTLVGSRCWTRVFPSLAPWKRSGKKPTATFTSDFAWTSNLNRCLMRRTLQDSKVISFSNQYARGEYGRQTLKNLAADTTAPTLNPKSASDIKFGAHTSTTRTMGGMNCTPLLRCSPSNDFSQGLPWFFGGFGRTGSFYGTSGGNRVRWRSAPTHSGEEQKKKDEGHRYQPLKNTELVHKPPAASRLMGRSRPSNQRQAGKSLGCYSLCC